MTIVDPVVALAAACEQVRTGEVEEVELNFADEYDHLDGTGRAMSLQITVRRYPWQPNRPHPAEGHYS